VREGSLQVAGPRPLRCITRVQTACRVTCNRDALNNFASPLGDANGDAEGYMPEDEGASRKTPHVQSNIEFEPLLDVAEAARLLRIHPKTLRVKASQGIIPAVQIGRVWRLRASALNRWVEGISR
jgi:excisionase family DNA binding protein